MRFSPRTRAYHSSAAGRSAVLGTCRQDVGQHARDRGFGEKKIYEAGPRDIGLLDEARRRLERGKEALRDVPRLGVQSLGQAERETRGHVAVRGIFRALERDFRVRGPETLGRTGQRRADRVVGLHLSVLGLFGLGASAGLASLDALGSPSAPRFSPARL